MFHLALPVGKVVVFTLITFLVQTFAPVPSDLGLVGAHHGEPGFFVERNYWPGIFRPAMGPPFQTTIVGNQVWMSWPRMVRPKSRPKKKQRTEDDSDEPTTGGCDAVALSTYRSSSRMYFRRRNMR